jgi:hypothetical protein
VAIAGAGNTTVAATGESETLAFVIPPVLIVGAGSPTVTASGVLKSAIREIT